MQQSNAYIIAFAAGLTIVLGGLLATTAVSLKDRQKEQVELDAKKQILSAVMDTRGIDKAKLAEIYSQRIQSVVVDANGDEVSLEGKDKLSKAEDISIRKEYKKNAAERLYPVYKYMSESGQVDAYILPMYGFGLWDDIWGFAAVKPDFNTLKGVVLDHKAETPGLGARITSAEVQDRYKGKLLRNSKGELVSVAMMKGENNASLTDYQVDGMSGATITANGVNAMLKNYISQYDAYFKSVQANM